MVNLIDHTYFRNRLQIANALTDVDVQSALNTAIADYQYEFLNVILGPALYQQFTAWYGINPADTTSPFYYLLNGQTFTATMTGYYYNFLSYYSLFGASTPTITWVGLVNDIKQSPIANYVYFMYQRNNTTQTASAGESKTNSQNATASNAYNKSKTAWDQMAVWLQGFQYFMDTFFSGPALTQISNPLPYAAPVQIKVGVTPGLVANATSFTFDGTSGTNDWRGYDIFPERIGQGTMIRGVQYTWNIQAGVFNLLQPGDSLQPAEYFNITFGLSGQTFTQITSNGYWNDFRYQFYNSGFTKIINPF